jgi:hypothetical protein
MKFVSRFESDLLRVLHAILGRVPVEQVLPIVLEATPTPDCLSRDAVMLVQDALAKGCVHWLARNGGWRNARFLRDGQAKDGRLWQRTAPQESALRFSRYTLAFLIWLTATRPGTGKAAWRIPSRKLTQADTFLLFLAYEALHGTEAGAGLRASPAVQGNVLCRLAFPQEFLRAPALTAADYLPWTTGPGGCILEVQQQLLAGIWVELETAKSRISDWETMQALGRAQDRALSPFFETLEQTRRYDLARFALVALTRLLPASAKARFWIGGLAEAGLRLADRQATYRAALAFVSQTDRFKRWEQQARVVGYVDEGYTAAQLWKQDWEHYRGDVLHARSQALLQELDPMHQPGGIAS